MLPHLVKLGAIFPKTLSMHIITNRFNTLPIMFERKLEKGLRPLDKNRKW